MDETDWMLGKEHETDLAREADSRSLAAQARSRWVPAASGLPLRVTMVVPALAAAVALVLYASTATAAQGASGRQPLGDPSRFVTGLVTDIAAGASSTRGERDLSVIQRHQALGRLQPPPDRDSSLGDVRVTVDRTAVRRHWALGLLPDNLATGASAGGARAENSAFDWGDGAIGFGMGATAVGLVIALATRAWRRTTARSPAV